jgi:hypothetical protein
VLSNVSVEEVSDGLVAVSIGSRGLFTEDVRSVVLLPARDRSSQMDYLDGSVYITIIVMILRDYIAQYELMTSAIRSMARHDALGLISYVSQPLVESFDDVEVRSQRGCDERMFSRDEERSAAPEDGKEMIQRTDLLTHMFRRHISFLPTSFSPPGNSFNAVVLHHQPNFFQTSVRAASLS